MEKELIEDQSKDNLNSDRGSVTLKSEFGTMQYLARSESLNQEPGVAEAPEIAAQSRLPSGEEIEVEAEEGSRHKAKTQGKQ